MDASQYGIWFKVVKDFNEIKRNLPLLQQVVDGWLTSRDVSDSNPF
jgi:hypothetical protein